MESIFRDLKYSFRALRQSPGFTLSAILALTLGIGGNAAMFSVVHSVLWRPLPYQNAEEVVRIYETNPGRNIPQINVAPGNFDDFRAASRTFRAIAASRSQSRVLNGSEGPVSLSAEMVSPGYFDVLRANTVLGRTFLPGEDAQGENRVAVLSYRAWRSRFAADPNIVGKTIQLDGENHRVAGVMAPEAEWRGSTDLWLPLSLDPREVGSRGAHNLTVLGRLKPGITVSQGEADLQGVAASLAERYPLTNAGWTVGAMAIREEMVRDVRPTLLLLLAAVGLVLLIACANVANLLLVRAAGRQREVAIRIAMGASRGRIVSQLLAESTLLSAAGTVLGLLLAAGSVKWVLSVRPGLLPRLESFTMNGSLLAFMAGLAILSSLFFGLAPALQLAATELTGALRDGGRGSTSGRGHNRLRTALVVAEVAISLLLLVCTGLVVRSLAALTSVEPGFRERDVLTLYVSLPQVRYQEDARIARFYSEALRRVRDIPGVQNAGGVSALPMTGANLLTRFEVEGGVSAPLAGRPQARYDTATPGYFETLGIPLRAGRTFTERDNLDSPPVAIISETLARRYFQGRDPIGKKITFNAGSQEPREIVGVVGDVKHQSLDEGPRVAIYDPAFQTTLSFLWISVRAPNVQSLAPAVLRAIAAVDKDQPVDHVRTMEEVIAESVFRRRFAGILVGGFTLLAVVLAAVGIYGVIAYSVEQRRTEIGIRLALGARHEDVLRMVLRQGLSMALAGAAIGVVLSLAATRVLGAILYGVGPADPVTYISAFFFLVVIVMLACLIPARRVISIHPATALRSE